MVDAAALGLMEAAALLRARELSAAELLAACEAAIDRRNGGPPSFDGAPGAVNAWVRLYPERAAADARAADGRLAREGDAAPLVCGIPIGCKDVIGVAGLPLTASSRVLDGNVAQRDAVAWGRLAAQGMVLVGHTHTHEFAAGGTTDQVGNPHDLQRSAGGSSGGSAAALAAGMVPATLGTDTAGSVRIPAALCGISSIKPTHGLIPLDGILALAASLDHIGPMARSVVDCSALLGALASGGAQRTPLTPPPAAFAPTPTAPRAGPRPLAGMRVALTDRATTLEIEPDVLEGLERARVACSGLGATIVDVPAPASAWMDDFSTILFSEVAAHHAHHLQRAERYRTSIREFVELAAAFESAAGYIAAQAARTQTMLEWEDWFAEHRIDAVLEPTVPSTAGPRGEGYDTGRLGGETDPLIALTATWNITGFPVVALPAGRGTRTGLPVGASLIGGRGDEFALVQAAIDLQEHALGTSS